MSDTKLAELLCTKFCHDITGPVGAVSNGAEFLREEMKDVQSQAADLIESASKEAVARVQFYRQAYGVGSTGSMASLTDMQSLAKNFFAFGKTKLVWDDKYTDMSGIEFPHSIKKVVLNLLSLAGNSLIKGGTLTFEATKEAITITAKGDMIKLDQSYEDCLKGKSNADLDAKLVQVYYTQKLIAEAGTQLTLDKTADSLVFTIKL